MSVRNECISAADRRSTWPPDGLFLAPPEAPEFLLDVEETIKKLEEIRDRPRQHAGSDHAKEETA